MQGSSTDTKPKKSQNIQKIFFHIQLYSACFTDHFGKKPFQISLRNSDAIVNIFIVKTEDVRLFFDRNVVYNVESRFIYPIQLYLKSQV